MAKMRDVAALAGVSSATVSRVLNDIPVDPAMAERVRVAAAELGYRTNGVARSLRRQRAAVLALIISDVANPFFTSVARGVEDVAQRAGYSVVLCNSDEDSGKEAKYIDVAERERVSGVILSPNISGSDISRLTAANIPVVAVDRPLREPVDSVLVHSREGARDATSHLLDQGWRRPACVTGPAQAHTAMQRLTGYLEALRDRGKRTTLGLVRYTDYRSETARKVVASLLDEAKAPDSLFVANSSIALGALQELSHRGLRAGTDIGLIAFDDAPWAPFVDPPMSVVAQPAYELGTHAATLLLDRIGGKAPQRPRTILLSTTLIPRASSRG
jgi:LacI family transcriptional regulator, galactose operon repressor